MPLPGDKPLSCASVLLLELRGSPACPACEQASHGGELATAVDAGVVSQADVTELGSVLTGNAEGRRSAGDMTLFDSTGLAIQDLGIAKAAFAKASELDLATISL